MAKAVPLNRYQGKDKKTGTNLYTYEHNGRHSQCQNNQKWPRNNEKAGDSNVKSMTT